MTKAPAVKAYLKTLLDGMPMTGTDKLQVTFGFPMRNVQKKWMFVGETEWQSVEWVTNRSREEVFDITIGFSAEISGGTAEEAEQFASQMASDFESALTQNPGMSGLCVTSIFFPKRLNSWAVDLGFQAQFETVVTATCRP